MMTRHRISRRAARSSPLESLARQVAGDAAPSIHTERDPHRALARARELAGPGGVALATGSIYLVADLLRPAGARMRSTL